MKTKTVKIAKLELVLRSILTKSRMRNVPQLKGNKLAAVLRHS